MEDGTRSRTAAVRSRGFRFKAATVARVESRPEVRPAICFDFAEAAHHRNPNGRYADLLASSVRGVFPQHLLHELREFVPPAGFRTQAVVFLYFVVFPNNVQAASARIAT